MFEQFQTPYKLKDSLKWAWRYLKGGDHNNPHNLDTKRFLFRSGLAADRRLLLIGDLMGLSGKKLKFSIKLKNFFSRTDYIIGNLEGPLITSSDLVFIKQYNSPEILESLGDLAPLNKWAFNLANNHIFDYADPGYISTINHLNAAGAHYFGVHSKPFFQQSDFAVCGATELQNISSQYPVTTSDLPNVSEKGFQILYPHWGEEFCYFPTEKQINDSKKWLFDFDLIAGHHPHTPQPTVEVNGRHCTYSLGNFYIYFNKPMLRVGKILEIGLREGQLVHLEEHFCQTHFPDAKTVFVDLKL